MATLLRTRLMHATDLASKSRLIFRVDTPTRHAATSTPPKVEPHGDDGRPQSHTLIYTCSVRPRHERKENS